MQYPVRHVVQAHVVLGVSRRVPVRAVGDVVVFEVDANLVRRRRHRSRASRRAVSSDGPALVARTAVERIHDAAPVCRVEPHAVARLHHHRPAPELVRAQVDGRDALRQRVLNGEPGIRRDGNLPRVDGSHQRLEPRELGGVAEVGVPHRIPGGEHVPQSLRLIVARRMPRGFLRPEAHAERGEKSAAPSARRRRRRPRAAADARVEVPTADRRAVVAGGGGFGGAGSQAPAAVVRLAVAGVVALAVERSPQRVWHGGRREGGRRGNFRHAQPQAPLFGDAPLVVVVHLPAHVADVFAVVFVQGDDHARHGGTPRQQLTAPAVVGPHRVLQDVVVPRAVEERNLKRHGEPNRRGRRGEAQGVRVARDVRVLNKGHAAEQLQQRAHVPIHHLLKVAGEPNLGPLARSYAVHPRHDHRVAPSRRGADGRLLGKVEPVPDVQLHRPAQHRRELPERQVRKSRRLQLVQPAHHVLVLTPPAMPWPCVASCAVVVVERLLFSALARRAGPRTQRPGGELRELKLAEVGEHGKVAARAMPLKLRHRRLREDHLPARGAVTDDAGHHHRRTVVFHPPVVLVERPGELLKIPRPQNSVARVVLIAPIAPRCERRRVDAHAHPRPGELERRSLAGLALVRSAIGQVQRLGTPLRSQQRLLALEAEPDGVADGGKHELERVSLRGEYVPVVRQRRGRQHLVVLVLNLLVQLCVFRGHRGGPLHVRAHEDDVSPAVDAAAVAPAPVLRA